MRAIPRMGGKVALINRLIAVFHGSETLKKTFSHSLEPSTHRSRRPRTRNFTSRMLRAHERQIRAFGGELLHFSIVFA